MCIVLIGTKLIQVIDMNERIKELAIEAGLIASAYNGFDPTGLTKAQKKFAELIVQEYSYDVMNLHGASPERVAMAAKHWGVEL